MRMIDPWLGAILGPVLALGTSVVAFTAEAYPLDAFQETGIRRLDFYYRGHLGEISNVRKQHPGALLSLQQVAIASDPTSWPEHIPRDHFLEQELRKLLGPHHAGFGVSLIDLSVAGHPRRAELNGNRQENIGSVGKLLVAVALLDQLAVHWPITEERENLLRQTWIRSSEIVRGDHHKVPIWNRQSQQLQHRPLKVDDRGNLWEYLDWMMSASSNAAGSVVMQQIILMQHMGRPYAESEEARERTWQSLSPTRRGALLAKAMDNAMQNVGLDPEVMRQGSLFTRTGKYAVIGRRSSGTPADLSLLLYQMQRGELIDRFSSLELKRLMYVTQQRIRYASHPALSGAAVYFKSGSLYSCEPEPGFVCGKYQGNRVNLLTSTALIEMPYESSAIFKSGSTGNATSLRYIVSITSNILRKNSAVAHQTLAGKIHRWLLQLHQPEPLAYGG